MTSALETINTRAFAIRFVAFGSLMAFANVIPFILTRGAYQTDGHEVAGFPFRCYDFGGMTPIMKFDPWAMTGNIVIAVVIAAVAATVFREGIVKTLRRWQNWGTPYAD